MLILLDIDGVMVTTPSWKRVEVMEDGFSAFNANAVSSLKKIIAETQASIVLTTSHKARFNVSEWKIIFQNRGINVSCITTLSSNLSGLNRREEVLNWINSQQQENFVVIDDDKSLNDLPVYLKEKCILTSPLIGLNDEDAYKAINILISERMVCV